MASRKIKPNEGFTSQPRHELLQIADVVAREKNIERDEVLFAMEQAIQKAARAKYGPEHDIRVLIDRTTGEVTITRYKRVVEVVEDESTQILLSDAKVIDAAIELDDELSEDLPPIEFGRVAAQSARQVIFQKVREAERSHVYEEYKERIGEVMSGIVKRIEFGNVILDLGRGEGILRREEIIPRETFRVGDRVRVLITEIRPDARGPMISTSRTHPHFMARLFEQEVPEIYDGIIEIKGVARDPGSRAKMSVLTNDSSLDAVGSCVGIRGSRVQAIVNEFHGEKVDIIPWSENPATYVVNALAPAEVIRVVLDEDTDRVQVVVTESQLSLAIGRRGQNVRLASQLTGWSIDIITEVEDQERRAGDLSARTNLFMKSLDVDEMLAQLLAVEGFQRVEDIAYSDVTEFAAIEGLDEDIGAELQKRALDYMNRRDQEIREKCKTLGTSEDLINFESLDAMNLLKLSEAGIKTLNDFADLAGDEVVEILGEDTISLDAANEAIMSARAGWFEN
ncbi:MAG: transcription termination factor NusA [Candidatus Paracaedibacteraceae bacterium]|nr:transcription termination factor NusA [Candidatus Paracaedibacteraceae bacterium]